MPEFVQLPGDLGLRFVPGDELSVSLSFQTDLTGYTVASQVYLAGTVGSSGGFNSVNSIGTTVVTPSITIANQTAGVVLVGLSESQTASLAPGGNYRWYLRWVAPGDITRTVVSGSVTSVAP